MSTNIKTLKTFGVLGLFFSWNMAQAQVKFGNNPGIKDPSAIVEIESTNRGFLLPRMTTADMTAISNPVNGLQIYNTTTHCIWIYRNSTWQSMCDPNSLGAWSLTGNSNTNPTTNFLGTTNAQDLVFKTNSIEQMRLSSAGLLGIGTTAPSAKLHVSGTTAAATPFSQLIDTITNAASFVNVWDHSGWLANTTVTPTSAAATTYTGGYHLLRSSSNNVANSTLVASAADVKYSGTGALSVLTGINSLAENRSSGTVATAYGGDNVVNNNSFGVFTSAIGIRGMVSNSSGGMISNARSVYARVQAAGTGTITNAYGIYSEFSKGGSATITNGYGLFVGDVLATNGFGVYQTGIDDINYLGGKTGIGINKPAEMLDVRGTAVYNFNADVDLTSYGTDFSTIRVRKSNGTDLAPTIFIGGNIASFEAEAYDGANFQKAAKIVMASDDAIGAGDMPGNIQFFTSPIGSAIPTQKMIIRNDGKVGIGTSTPNSTLQINGSVGMSFMRTNADWTLDETNHIVLANATNAPITLTLPLPISCVGRTYVVGKSDETANLVTFSPSLKLTETTDVSSLAFAKKYKIISDGANWWIYSE